MKMKNLIHTAVVTLFAASAAHAQQAVQWKVSDGGNGHWYAVVSSGLDAGAGSNWEVLDSTSRQQGGRLCTISGSGENSFVSNLVTAFRPVNGFWAYMGATQISNIPCGGDSWMWNDGTAWTFTNWQPQQPDCLIGSCSSCDEPKIGMRSFSGQWGDWNGRDLTSAIIEWSADCNNDGIVDYGQCHDGTLPDYNGNNIPDCCEQGTPCLPGRYPLQWRSEDGGNGHWYQASANLGLTFLDARAWATIVGGDLVTPQSPAELDFVFRNLAADPAMWWYFNGIPRHGPWIGLRQDRSRPDYSEPAGGWTWIDGTYATFQNWDLDTCQNQPTDCFCGGGCGLDNAGFYEGDPASGNTVPTWGAFAADMSGRVGGVIIEWSADCNNDGIVDYGQILQGQLVDANTNGIPDICEGPTCNDIDLNLNGIVDGGDLGVLLAFWGPVSPAFPRADINKDGFVNGADLGILLAFWGPCLN